MATYKQDLLSDDGDLSNLIDDQTITVQIESSKKVENRDSEKQVPFSADEDFDELCDKDKTVELIGYVDEINASKEVGQGTKYRLFTFTLNNASKKRIQCLIWDDLINLHEPNIRINSIMHIDGGYCKATKLSFQKEAAKYVPFELVIQKNTVLDIFGLYRPKEMVLAEPTLVNFETISLYSGLITIHGYLKTKFAITPSRYETMSYGCGSITDGVHKITVQISNYTPIGVLEKGTAVIVTGEIDNNGAPITISCPCASSIVPDLGKSPMPNEKLLRSVKTPKRKSI